MELFITSLVFFAIFLAFMSQTKKGKTNTDFLSNQCYYYKRFNKFKYWLTFFILAAICFLNKSGNDISWYASAYTDFTWSSLSNFTIEPGYKIFNILLRFFIKDGYLGIGVIKSISIFLVFKAIYNLRSKISVGLAILTYCSLLYIYNFQLLRIMLAVGIIFLAFSYELTNQRGKCLILLFSSPFFHYTSIIVLIIYLIYLLLGNKMSIFKIAFLLTSLLLVFKFSFTLLNFFVTNIGFFNKYRVYVNLYTSDFGFGQLLVFLPLAAVLISYYEFEKSERNYVFTVLFSLTTLLIGLLGYNFTVISRTTYYFYFVYVYYFSTLPLKCKGSIELVIGNMKFPLQELLLTISIIGMSLLYIYNGGITNAGLEKYIFIFQ